MTLENDTELNFYTTPQESWNAMYDDCVKSETSIDFEQYILSDDEEGMKFLELFRDKARKGISIRLILDRIGSRTLYASKIIHDIVAAGGRVHFYNKIGILNLFAPKTWFPRNHSKLMLIDSKIAYVGSVCVSKEMAEWRDLHARLTGSIVNDIQDYFAHVWTGRYRGWRKRVTKKMRYEKNKNSDFTFVAALTRLRTNYIYKELLLQIRSAQKSVYLVTPYFLPPFLLRHALFQAAKRGVDVKIMMSAESDSALADYVSQSYFHKFIRLGLHILLFKPNVIHAKYAIIDGKWATMGSTNMDYLSLRRNREANILIRHQPTIDRLMEQFRKDTQDCMQADYDFCRNRPFYNKLIGRLGRTLKQIL